MSSPGALQALPCALDTDSVSMLHRHDGFITLATIQDGKYQDRAAIKASEIQDLFPSFAQELLADSFYSVNGFFRSGKGKRELAGVRVASPYRKSEGVKYLTCCYADLDVYRAGVTVAQARQELIHLEHTEQIPAPSMLAYSGRGVWCFWMLKDRDNPEQALRAHDSIMPKWRRVQRALFDRLQGIGADPQARDVSRVTRIPGSVNSKSGSEVRYLWLTNAAGESVTYTLDDLTRFLKVSSFVPEVYHNPEQLFEKKGDTQNRSRGWRALWLNRMQYLDRLEALREGWHPGHRNNAIFLMALFMRKTGAPPIRICEAVRRSARLCGMEYPELESIIRDIKRLDKYHRISDAKIIEFLQVKPGEALEIGWTPRKDQYWTAGARVKRSLSRAEKVNQRRALIESAPEGLSIRQIQVWCKDNGLSVSFETIRKDLARLGKRTPKQSNTAAQGLLFSDTGQE